eukprot:1377999-Amorphochlora_amoeboformis.AAC.3
MAFVELNDGEPLICLSRLTPDSTAKYLGSSSSNLQIILDKEFAGEGVLDDVFTRGGTGVSLRIVGEIVESPKSGQAVELKAKTVIVLGWINTYSLMYFLIPPPLFPGGVDAKAYPMPKKALTLEYMRARQNW